MTATGRSRDAGVAIAVAQTCAVAGDVAANVEQHRRLGRLAVLAGARLVLFPELSLTGYEIGLAERLAFTTDDARLAPLLAFAADSGATLVVGAPVRLASSLHIGSLIVTPVGVVDLYTKRRLGAFPPGASRHGTVPPAERTVFRPGDRDPLLPVGTASAAFAICADVGDPEHAIRAAGRGASVYLASVFVIPSDLGDDVARLRSVARQQRMLVAMSNHGCVTGGLESAGSSAIWSPSGDLLVQLPGSGSAVAVAQPADSGWVTAVHPLANTPTPD